MDYCFKFNVSNIKGKHILGFLESATFLISCSFSFLQWNQFLAELMNLFKYIKFINDTFLNCFWLHSNCGIPDPSWSEIRHFVSFLNSQLRDCEQSFFCDMKLMRSVLAGANVLNLEGFRSFVVRFMIQMSRVSRVLISLWRGHLMSF